MDIVALKNGAEGDKYIIRSAMECLTALFNKNPTATYDLAIKARDPNYRLSETSERDFQFLLFLDSQNTMPDYIKNIVISATEGGGPTFITDPIKPKPLGFEFC